MNKLDMTREQMEYEIRFMREWDTFLRGYIGDEVYNNLAGLFTKEKALQIVLECGDRVEVENRYRILSGER